MKPDISWTKLPVLNLTPGFEPFGPSTAGTVEYIDYPSGVEPHVRITPNVQREGAESRVLFTARPTNPSDLMRVLLAPSAWGVDVGVGVGVEMFLPYMPHARQDRRAVPADAESLLVMQDLLRAAGYRRIHVFDMHNPEALGSTGSAFEKTTVKNHFPSHFLAEVVLQEHIMGSGQPLVVVPDHGMMRRLMTIVAHEGYGPSPSAFAGMMIRHEVMVCEKTRDAQTGALSVNVPRDCTVSRRTCVIVDDICDGGGTFVPIIKALYERGADRVVLAVSHGLFTKGMKPLKDAGLAKVYTTNSWPYTPTPKVKLPVHIIDNWQTLLGA